MNDSLACEDLLVRIAARDEAALAELHTRLAPPLLGLISRVVPDAHAASAAVEETFIHLWRAAPAFPAREASVAAWLVVMVRRVALDQRRRRNQLGPPGHDSFRLLEESFDWLPRPGDIARIEDRRDLLKKVVNQLPKSQRVVLELAAFHALSAEEIAGKLGEPLGRVNATLRAGMRFIRHRMRAVLGTWSASI